MTTAEYAAGLESLERALIARALDVVPGFDVMVANVPGAAVARLAALLLDVAPEQAGLPRQLHPYRRNGGWHVRA